MSSNSLLKLSLVQSGRCFFGLNFSKCKAAKYNVGNCFYDGCSGTGVLGAYFLNCKQGELRTYNDMHTSVRRVSHGCDMLRKLWWIINAGIDVPQEHRLSADYCKN